VSDEDIILQYSRKTIRAAAHRQRPWFYVADCSAILRRLFSEHHLISCPIPAAVVKGLSGGVGSACEKLEMANTLLVKFGFHESYQPGANTPAPVFLPDKQLGDFCMVVFIAYGPEHLPTAESHQASPSDATQTIS
jgi:hypothetical protein